MKLPEYNDYRANEPLHNMSANADPFGEAKSTASVVLGFLGVVAAFGLIGYGVISLLRTIIAH